MPADEFLQYRAQIGTTLFALASLVRDLPDSDVLLGAVSHLSSSLKEPLRIAIAGDVGSGKSTLLNVLFEADFCHTHPSSPNKPIYIHRHSSQPPLVEAPPGVVEQRGDQAFLRDFTVMDAPGLRPGDRQTVEHIESALGEFDIFLFALHASDPWKAELWDFLMKNRASLGPGFALLLLQTDTLPDEERGAVVKYLQQTAVRKLGISNASVVPVSARQAQMAMGGDGNPEELARSSNLTELYGFLGRALSHPHPRMSALAGVAANARDISRETAQLARQALEDLRHDEREILKLERGIITQLGWLRKELRERVAFLQQASLKPVETVEAAFAASIQPTRLDALAHNREELARNLHEGLVEMLGSDFSSHMDETARRFETHLSESWDDLFGRLRPLFIKDLKGPVAAFPHLKEAHGALLTRVELHLQETLLSHEVVQHAKGMLGQTASINLQPIVIILASILAGALAAFQSGCEIAGGMIFGVGVLATVWSVVTGIGFRRLVRRRYRQLCDSQVRELLVRVRGELEGFAESILEEIGKKLRAMSELGYATRATQEPLVEKASRIAETFEALASRFETKPPAE